MLFGFFWFVLSWFVQHWFVQHWSVKVGSKSWNTDVAWFRAEQAAEIPASASGTEVSFFAQRFSWMNEYRGSYQKSSESEDSVTIIERFLDY